MMNVEELKCCAHEVDVVVHIDDHLDENHRSHIEGVIECTAGVMKARFNSQRHHLMIVAYDPKRINAASILNSIKGQNVSAQLVGGI
jgi:hypothetical protein